MIEQGSEEWFEARLGKITASRVSDVMARTKTGYGAARKNYMAELLCQRLTGQREDGYTNAAMQRGIDLEPIARSAYEVETGLIVEEVGFITHPTDERMGASPDGLVGEDGLVEIKCPNTAQHIATLQSEKPDPRYIKQMQFQMSCTDRAWCDFVSFDDRLPEPLQLFVFRVERDSNLIGEILTECEAFLGELEQMERNLRVKMERIAEAAA